MSRTGSIVEDVYGYSLGFCIYFMGSFYLNNWPVLDKLIVVLSLFILIAARLSPYLGIYLTFPSS